MSDRRRRAVETKLRRMAGASPERRQAIASVMETVDDLHTTCRWCKKRRRGSLEELKKPCGCQNGETGK